jgi:hypothetical protein
MKRAFWPVVLLAVVGASAPAGEPAADKKEAEPQRIEVQPPFDKLVTGDYPERLAALTALVPRAAELADAAKAEAARLRALPPPKEGSVGRRIMDFATGALDALAAESELMKTWKPGLPAAAEKVKGQKVALDCKDTAIEAVLKRGSAAWGVTLELSPAGTVLRGALDVSLVGSPTLKEFVDWLCAEQGLVCGQAGGKVVLVPPAALQLQANIEKAKGERRK